VANLKNKFKAKEGHLNVTVITKRCDEINLGTRATLLPFCLDRLEVEVIVVPAGGVEAGAALRAAIAAMHIFANA
jgi:hypothetical protein